MEYQTTAYFPLSTVLKYVQFQAMAEPLKPLSADHYCTINSYLVVVAIFFSIEKWICWLDRKWFASNYNAHFRHSSIYFALNALLPHSERDVNPTACRRYILNQISILTLEMFERRNQSMCVFFSFRICTRFPRKKLNAYSLRTGNRAVCLCFRLNQKIILSGISMHSYAITGIFNISEFKATHTHTFVPPAIVYFMIISKITLNYGSNHRPLSTSLASSPESSIRLFLVRPRKNIQITK